MKSRLLERVGFVSGLLAATLSGLSAATTSSSTAFNFNHSGSVSTGLVAVGSAFANSSTTAGPALNLPQFNSALGTLTEADVAFSTSTSNYTVTGTGLLSLISNASAALSLNTRVTAGATVRTGASSTSAAGSALVTLLNGGPGAIASPSLSAAQNTASFVSPVDLAAFIGSGNFQVGLSAVDAFTVGTSVSLLNGAGFTGTGAYAGTVTVTYTYTPAAVAVAPSISGQPASASVAAGTTASFSVTASGSGTLTYQWSKNGIAIAGATGVNFTIVSAQPTDAAAYSVIVTNAVGSATSTLANLTVATQSTLPVIGSQPSSQTATIGSAVTLSVGASGSGLTYVWLKNGTPIASSLTGSFTMPAVQTADAGTYTVAISNAAGTVTSLPAVLQVVAATGVPFFSSQPSPAEVAVGGTATFSATAAGVGVNYQWNKNGSAITGATGSVLALGNVQLADAGTYSVTASNSVGAVTSNSASLSVDPANGGGTSGTGGTGGTTPAPVVITVQPTSQSVNAGSAITLTSGTSNAGATYQWYKDGTAIAGATSSTYAILNAQPSDAANYTVQISSGGAATTTNAAYVLILGGTFSGGSGNGGLLNISARGVVGTGSNALVAGFITSGLHQYIVRGVGPGLTTFGVAGVLAAPQLRLYRGTAQLAENDNWTVGSSDLSGLTAAMAAVGAFSLSSTAGDDAMLVTLPSGPYSIQVTGANNTTGTALAEVYLVQ